MEASSGSRLEKGEGGVMVLAKPTRPKLTLPPQNPAEAFLRSSDSATPSPMTFVSSLFAEQDPYADSKSFSQLLAGAMASPTTTHIGEEEPGLSSTLTGSHGSLSGSGSSKISRSDTAKFKSMMPSRLPIPRSPYLTIPPGLSPTTLLDSPVLFSTGQAEPSPTTGTFSLPPLTQERGPTGAPACEHSKERSPEQDGSPSFVFKPYPSVPTSIPSPLASMGSFGFSHQQVVAEVQVQAQSQNLSGSSGIGISPLSETTPLLSSGPSSSDHKLVIPSPSQGPVEPTVGSLTEDSESLPLAQVQVPAHLPPHLVEKPSEDGYNWRKYGQKQVKGSEYPRSYYKCTTPNCSVKKKVERSHDGQVTEIVYRGEHNHAKPQATRRAAMGGAHIPDGAARGTSHAEASHGFGNADSDKCFADLSSSSRWQVAPFSGGSAATPEPSLGSTSDDDGEDGEASKVDDNDDEPDSKHRKIEKANETLPLRTVREPRVVVQTTSEIDILDDGYRWRKYGQKVVKGSAHPRSYYKCTNLGCTVRKHVERSSTDFKAVITTYEGKHNHDVPAPRNSNHDTSGASTVSAPPPAGSAVTGLGAFSTSTLAKPLPSLQEQLFGKPLEDRFKAGDITAVGVESGSGGSMKGPLASEQNKGQGALAMSIPSSMSLLGSGSTVLESAELFRQGFGWRPKEEPGEFHSSGSSLPIHPSSSASFAPLKILLGP